MPLADMIRVLEEMQVLAEKLVQSSDPGSMERTPRSD
jgi:hypothetical protein